MFNQTTLNLCAFSLGPVSEPLALKETVPSIKVKQTFLPFILSIACCTSHLNHDFGLSWHFSLHFSLHCLPRSFLSSLEYLVLNQDCSFARVSSSEASDPSATPRTLLGLPCWADLLQKTDFPLILITFLKIILGNST